MITWWPRRSTSDLFNYIHMKTASFLLVLMLLLSCQENAKEGTQSNQNPESQATPPEVLEEASVEETEGTLKDENRKELPEGHSRNLSAFPQLKSLKLEGVSEAYVLYEAEQAEIINKKDPKEEGEGTIVVLKAMLDAKNPEIYTVLFQPGLSNDPFFIIRRGNREIGSLEANELILPGSGIVYTTGHTNKFFDERRKYQLKDGKLREVKQPFLHVGLQTKAKSAIVLYSSTDYRQVLTTLPKNTEVEVLVANGKNYLIRTPFGLTGWWKNDSGKETPFENLQYQGD
jgi:hypothetical protein